MLNTDPANVQTLEISLSKLEFQPTLTLADPSCRVCQKAHSIVTPHSSSSQVISLFTNGLVSAHWKKQLVEDEVLSAPPANLSRWM
eukprot:66160-Amphidinium_carterae.1